MVKLLSYFMMQPNHANFVGEQRWNVFGLLLMGTKWSSPTQELMRERE